MPHHKTGRDYFKSQQNREGFVLTLLGFFTCHVTIQALLNSTLSILTDQVLQNNVKIPPQTL